MAITAAKLIVEVDAETNRAITGLKNMESQLHKLAGSGGRVGDIFAGILGANLIQNAVSGLKNLAAEGLQAFTSYERLGLALQSLTAREILNTGAAKNMTQAYAAAGPKAKELLDWTQKLAIQSPFTQDDVAQAYRMALAYGFTTDEAKRLTGALIDFSAGTGATGENMQRIALALGQIQAKGKIAGQEVLQLVNAGLAVDRILAEAFGKSTAEIVEMREKGLIPADQAIQAIVSSLENDFGGAAAKQSETFAGLVSSMEDIKQVGLREFFTGTFEAIRPYLKEFVDSFTNGDLTSKIREWGDEFGQFALSVIEKVKNMIEWWGNLDGSTQKLIIGLGAFLLLKGPILNMLADVVGGVRILAITIAELGGPITVAIALFGAALAAATRYKNKLDAIEDAKLAGVAKTWDQFGVSVATAGKTVTQVLDEYAAAQKKVAEQQPTSGWVLGSEVHDMTGNLGLLSEGLLVASKNFGEYETAIQQAAAMGGYLVDVNGDIYKDLGGATVLIEGMRFLTEEEYNSAKAADELRRSLSAYVDGPLRNVQVLSGTAAPKIKELGDAFKALQDKAAGAILQASLSGTLAKSMDEYKQTIADLGPAHDELVAKLEYLNVSGWIPSAESVEKLAEKLRDENSAYTEGEALKQAEIMLLASHQSQLDNVKKALGENEAAQRSAAEAMKLATAEMIYQQASAGLDAEASLGLARAMGLISEADYTVASSLQNLRLKYDEMDGSLDGTIGDTKAYTGEVLLFNQAVQNLNAANLPLTFANIQTAMENLSTADVSSDDLLPDNEAFTTAKVAYDTFKTDSVTALGEIATQAQTTATETAAAFTGTDWKSAGTTIGTGLSKGVTESTFKTDMALLLTTVKTMWTSEAGWPAVGLYVITEVAKGITNNVAILEDAIRAAVSAAIAAGGTVATAVSVGVGGSGSGSGGSSSTTNTNNNSVVVNANVSSQMDMDLVIDSIKSVIRSET